MEKGVTNEMAPKSPVVDGLLLLDTPLIYFDFQTLGSLLPALAAIPSWFATN